METFNPDSVEDITSVFENFKKQQLEPVKGFKLKKKRSKKRSNSSLKTEASNISCENVVEPLPMELLERLENSESSSPPKKPKKKKKKIVVTSATVEDSYIPLEAGCSTNFSLVRLDKSENSSSASTALEFYNNRLYGSRIPRVSADSLLKGMKKTQAKKALAKRFNK